MDARAIRANEDTVSHVDVNGALLTAISALFVARAPHEGAKNFLVLFLYRRHVLDNSGRLKENWWLSLKSEKVSETARGTFKNDR